jgi:hypothetical protein
VIPKNHYTGVMTNAGDSREYVFDVKVIALVRVRALDESSARRVITSVLGSPSADVIKLANEINFVMAENATVIAVDLAAEEGSIRLIGIDGNSANLA